MSTPKPRPRLRILPPRLVLLLLLTIAALWRFFPGPSLWTGPWRLLGAPLSVLGLAILLRASGQFRSMGTNIKTFDAPGRLVTTGWFRVSRNPMYLGFTLLLFGMATVTGGAFTFAPPLVFVLASQCVYIPFEESAMSRAFGEEYERYRRRVRRWL
jgi:protein-S-isoprenylcysteine O-methyltransferase Ste14